MHLCPSFRLLIHILAVLCLTCRLVSSQDIDLLREVRAADEAEAAAAKSTTDGSTDSTTDASTTDFSSTESIVSTSTMAWNLSCMLDEKKKECVLEGTEDLCDPCEGVLCDADKSCFADNSTCTTECLCTDELKIPNKDGVCVNPCEPSPCQNNQPCVLNVTFASKFICDCNPDYDGQFCENVHNYCLDAQPAKCPKGAFECVFKGVGKYECGCAGGHTLDEKTNSCTKVTERLNVTLTFPNTLYKEAYNVEGNADRQMALDAIGTAMKTLYGDLLISIAYDNFTQGSLIAHYSMDMRMAANGDPKENVYDLQKFVTNCASTANPTCFGKLGAPFLAWNAVTAEDLRCEDVFCPEGTTCVPVDTSENSVRCKCKDGYKLIKTVKEDTGRLNDVCEDIDQCTVDNPCKDGQLCINNPGSFECVGSPCDKNPCQGNAVCKAIDHYAYNCECEWIYIASDCGTPWPLILVIVSSVLLALLIIAIIGNCVLFTRSRKGSYSIFTTKESTSPYDRYGSTSDRS